MKSEELYDYFLHFGEDPFVRSNYTLNESVKAIVDNYSFRNYAKRRSLDICRCYE